MPTVSVRRIIDAPQEEVWAVLADIEQAGRWNTAWERIEFISSQREGAGTLFRAHTSDGLAHEFEIIEWAPPEFIAFAPRPKDYEGDYLITLEAHAILLRPTSPQQTEVEVVASASTRGLRGWLAGWLLWPGYQRQGLRRALDELAALFAPEEDDSH